MGEAIVSRTGGTAAEHGIYQSTCTCRTAMTLLAGQTLPRCLGCDEMVEWQLVQRVRSGLTRTSDRSGQHASPRGTPRAAD